MSVITSPKLDKGVTVPNAPTMNYKKIGPLNNGSTVVITPAGGANDTIFELPANVAYMLPDAFFQWSQTTPLSVGLVHYMLLDSYGLIREITLRTKSQVILAQVRNFAQFKKLMNFYNTKKTDYEEKIHDRASTTNIFAPSNALVAANQRQTDAVGATSSVIPYYENQHLISSTAIGALGPPAVGDLTIPNVQLSLDIPETLFNIRKLLMTLEVLELVISWNPANNFMWDTTALGDPSTAPITLPVVDTTLRNVCLWLPIDLNPATSNQIRSEIMAGRFNMVIPYVYSQMQGVPLGVDHRVDFPLLPSQTKRLRKIYHSAFNTAVTGNLMNDNSNVGATKITRYRTYMNSLPEQDLALECGATLGTDYLFNKPYTKGSYVVNRHLYNYCHCHIADYTDGTTRAENDSKDNLSAGLPVNTSLKWTFEAVTPGAGVALTHMTFAVCEKVLSITAQNGITVI